MLREITFKIEHIFDMAFSLYKVILNYLVIFYHAKVYNNSSDIICRIELF